jgi:ABC-2 type transport system permease protein
VLSLMPITAPVTIMLRLGQGAVPLWQMLTSAGILALAVAGAVWLAARLFRGTTLLTGVKPTPRAIWSALRASS